MTAKRQSSVEMLSLPDMIQVVDNFIITKHKLVGRLRKESSHIQSDNIGNILYYPRLNNKKAINYNSHYKEWFTVHYNMTDCKICVQNEIMAWWGELANPNFFTRFQEVIAKAVIYCQARIFAKRIVTNFRYVNMGRDHSALSINQMEDFIQKCKALNTELMTIAENNAIAKSGGRPRRLSQRVVVMKSGKKRHHVK